MSEPKESAGAGPGELDRHQMMSALFASMVVNQVWMALMFLGRTPHPETGQTVKDLEGARLFIDQLEMLEAKTKGNLEPHERKLLRENLTALQMAFVEVAAEAPETSELKPASAGSDKPESAGAGSRAAGPENATVPAPEAESDSRKKFSKKY